MSFSTLPRASALASSPGSPGTSPQRGRRAWGLAAMAEVLRCVFGNPFRPLPARPFPPEVRALAEASYAAFPRQGPDLFVLQVGLRTRSFESKDAPPLGVRDPYALLARDRAAAACCVPEAVQQDELGLHRS